MTSPYVALFTEHRSARIPNLWDWQREVLDIMPPDGDAAIELPTGTGKTVVGLLVGEYHRSQRGRVAYLTGTKQLAQQVERQASDLSVPIVRFQGQKDTWRRRDVRAYNFGEAVGVMNYWAYFNARPGVESADLLILDDVHLLEGRLRDMFTLSVPAESDLFEAVLRIVYERCPYYSVAGDLLQGMKPPGPPEMVAFPDSLDLAADVRAVIDASLVEGTPEWWSWQQIRRRLGVCCWLVSPRAFTVTPFIPPAQTLEHFERPSRRLYMSATIGEVGDLRRRLGTPPFTKITAQVQPQQGQRFVVLGDALTPPTADELVDYLTPMLDEERKTLWLAARRTTAAELVTALSGARREPVLRLDGDNGADEEFSELDTGHLVTAGRYDGLDFPGDSCRLEVVPEVPVATSELEEWASAYLRDAAFADSRFVQRVVQALGRCNRTEHDRALYLLTDPEFVARFSRRSVIDQLPPSEYSDIRDALDRSDDGFWPSMEAAYAFLRGEDPPHDARAHRTATPPEIGDAALEVDGFHALWRLDHQRAADLFDRAAAASAMSAEYRSFWLAMRSLVLQEAAELGDASAATGSIAALRAAATAGAFSTFFTRLRLAESRRAGEAVGPVVDAPERLYTAWDTLIARLGAEGPSFDRWCTRLRRDLSEGTHDEVAIAVARVGSELLGLSSHTPRATAGEHDADWEYGAPHRVIAFEVKLAPDARRVVIGDIDQAEGAVRAAAEQTGADVAGILLTPWAEADPNAVARTDAVRLLRIDVMLDYVDALLATIREYRRGWMPSSAVRGSRREALGNRVPEVEAMWKAHAAADTWIDSVSG